MSDTAMKERIPLSTITLRPKVLIICNDEEKAGYYKYRFTELACEPTNAWSPDHALELFQSYRVNGGRFLLACMDLMLEGMNGITLGRHLHAIDPECLLYLFSSSHFFESPVLEDFYDFGGFVMEPDSPEKAFLHLRKLMF